MGCLQNSLTIQYTKIMTYEHTRGYGIIPVSTSENDIEPILEAEDPLGEAELNHLISQHPDLYSVFERIAYDYAENDKQINAPSSQIFFTNSSQKLTNSASRVNIINSIRKPCELKLKENGNKRTANKENKKIQKLEF